MKKFFAHFKFFAFAGIALCLMASVPTAEAAKSITLSMGTGGTSGAYFPVGGGLAEVANRSIPGLNLIAEVTAGSVENCRRVATDELQFGLANDFTLIDALNNNPPFAKSEKLGNLVAVATNHASLTALLVPADSPYKSVADLRGKSVSVGAPGSGNYLTAMNILAAYGMQEKDIKARYETFSETVESFKNGQVDCFMVQAGSPASSVIDITNSIPCRILPIEGEAFEKLIKACPYYVKAVVPAGMYKGIDEDVVTIKTWNTIFTNAEFDGELLYQLLSVWYKQENLDYLHTVHTSMKEMTLEDGPKVTVPLHPAAEKFWKDQGRL